MATTTSDFFRTVLLSIASVVSVPNMAGCESNSLQSTTLTFHAKVNWKPEDSFQDAQVVEFCRKIEANDLEGMEKLLAEGVDVNARGKGNMTPLMWAFPDNKFSRFKKLLEHGADPNIRFTSDLGVPSAFAVGDSVTTRAAKTRFPGYFEAVMRVGGGDPNSVDGFEMPLLHIIVSAMLSDAQQRCQEVIKNGADIDVLWAGTTPAMQAIATAGQYDLALFLLEHGANPHAYMENGLQSLVHVFLMKSGNLSRLEPNERESRQKLLNYLISQGVDVDRARADLERWSQKIMTPNGFKSRWQIELKQKREEQQALRQHGQSQDDEHSQTSLK